MDTNLGLGRSLGRSEHSTICLIQVVYNRRWCWRYRATDSDFQKFVVMCKAEIKLNGKKTNVYDCYSRKILYYDWEKMKSLKKILIW